MSSSTVSLTGVALLAFAANSILTRAALGAAAIDAAGFSFVRLASGAVTLLVLQAARAGTAPRRTGGTWAGGGWLFLYAVPFSFAYLTLSTGTGALILFGAVQATMLLAALAGGERPTVRQWLGLVAALAGLGYLVWPGVRAPSPVGSALMGAAGVAWGVYSLRGRGAADPLADTAGNFARSVPFVAVVALGALGLDAVHASAQGLALAATSGALASGVGYAVWYAALPNLTATVAATVQLSVPIIAAFGGVLLMEEVVTGRLGLSALLILGGICVAVVPGRHAVRSVR